MLEQREIKSKLIELGFKAQEVDKVIIDITSVCVAKFISEFYELSETEKEAVSLLNKEEIDAFYVNKMKELNQEQKDVALAKFNSVCEITWKEYFEFIKK
ncbi:MAG: hypothetical protein ACK4FA_02325 [Candidatus Paceibacteria bacterium]